MQAYTDGSFDGKHASWAYIIVKDNQIIHKNKGIITDPDKCAGFQIAGECQGVVEALKYAKENNLIIDIYHDYIGLYSWVADLFGDKAWKTNKSYTQEYRENVISLREHLNSFIKVKGHSGNRWNEEVDKYAKI